MAGGRQKGGQEMPFPLPHHLNNRTQGHHKGPKTTADMRSWGERRALSMTPAHSTSRVLGRPPKLSSSPAQPCGRGRIRTEAAWLQIHALDLYGLCPFCTRERQPAPRVTGERTVIASARVCGSWTDTFCLPKPSPQESLRNTSAISSLSSALCNFRETLEEHQESAEAGVWSTLIAGLFREEVSHSQVERIRVLGEGQGGPEKILEQGGCLARKAETRGIRKQGFVITGNLTRATRGSPPLPHIKSILGAICLRFRLWAVRRKAAVLHRRSREARNLPEQGREDRTGSWSGWGGSLQTGPPGPQAGRCGRPSGVSWADCAPPPHPPSPLLIRRGDPDADTRKDDHEGTQGEESISKPRREASGETSSAYALGWGLQPPGGACGVGGISAYGGRGSVRAGWGVSAACGGGGDQCVRGGGISAYGGEGGQFAGGGGVIAYGGEGGHACGWGGIMRGGGGVSAYGGRGTVRAGWGVSACRFSRSAAALGCGSPETRAQTVCTPVQGRTVGYELAAHSMDNFVDGGSPRHRTATNFKRCRKTPSASTAPLPTSSSLGACRPPSGPAAPGGHEGGVRPRLFYSSGGDEEDSRWGRAAPTSASRSPSRPAAGRRIRCPRPEPALRSLLPPGEGRRGGGGGGGRACRPATHSISQTHYGPHSLAAFWLLPPEERPGPTFLSGAFALLEAAAGRGGRGRWGREPERAGETLLAWAEKGLVGPWLLMKGALIHPGGRAQGDGTSPSIINSGPSEVWFLHSSHPLGTPITAPYRGLLLTSPTSSSLSEASGKWASTPSQLWPPGADLDITQAGFSIGQPGRGLRPAKSGLGPSCWWNASVLRDPGQRLRAHVCQAMASSPLHLGGGFSTAEVILGLCRGQGLWRLAASVSPSLESGVFRKRSSVQPCYKDAHTRPHSCQPPSCGAETSVEWPLTFQRSHPFVCIQPRELSEEHHHAAPGQPTELVCQVTTAVGRPSHTGCTTIPSPDTLLFHLNLHTQRLSHPRSGEHSSQHLFRLRSCLCSSVPDGLHTSPIPGDEEDTSSCCCGRLLPAACSSVYSQKRHYTLMSCLEASTFQPDQLLQGPRAEQWWLGKHQVQPLPPSDLGWMVNASHSQNGGHGGDDDGDDNGDGGGDDRGGDDDDDGDDDGGDDDGGDGHDADENDDNDKDNDDGDDDDNKGFYVSLLTIPHHAVLSQRPDKCQRDCWVAIRQTGQKARHTSQTVPLNPHAAVPTSQNTLLSLPGLLLSNRDPSFRSLLVAEQKWEPKGAVSAP
ncbi:hypothetical protein Cadr_000013118 [Camelus dromedarius]|uniref:Uncharacterized protein n=1 Tax=Camelus dromedarius TaxID=9838 RepID=A0A5N4DD21_CAMDR|nr:hypothetical protein Cadr_000013118 [Camelus dromedarius]